jgi:DNA phosphorothioation-associated putative methyltransferase
MLWAAIIDRGRVLDVEEIPDVLRERLRTANVSLGRATELCLSDSLNREGLAAAAAARKEDLLIHLALTLFPGAPRYTTLARSIQRDIRAFFGSHAVGIQEANALLFSVGKPEVVSQAVSAAVEGGLGGMRDAFTFRFHAPALNRLGAVLRVLVGCAGILRGGTEGADFIDIKLNSRRLTFLACKDATVRLPICSERTRVDLARLRVSVDQPDGMVLYLIGRFLPRDMPGATDQIAFDRKIVAAGIADEEGRGPGYTELNEMLRRRRTKAG